MALAIGLNKGHQVTRRELAPRPATRKGVSNLEAELIGVAARRLGKTTTTCARRRRPPPCVDPLARRAARLLRCVATDSSWRAGGRRADSTYYLSLRCVRNPAQPL